MKHPKTLVVVTDGGHARFLMKDAETHRFKELKAIESSTLHSRTHDMVSDRPGRKFQGVNNMRHGVGTDNYDPHKETKVAFVHMIAEEVNAGHTRGEFDRLALIAPVRALQELKEALAPAVQKTIGNEIQKDLTKATIEDIAQHLAKA